MKSLLLSFLMVFVLSLTYGQNFKVPERTLEQKHNRTLFLGYANIITGIAGAKKGGMTVADYAAFCGDLFKTTWSKDAGFNGAVNGFLANWEAFRRNQDPEIVILEQSDSKVVFKAKDNMKEMFSQGHIFEVTHADMLLWFDIIGKKITEYLGASYEQEEMEGDWLKVTLMKKKLMDSNGPDQEV